MRTPTHVLDYYADQAADEHALNGMEPDEFIDCPRCDGSGEIGFNLSRNRDPQCDDSATCPACHGNAMVPAHHFDICIEQPSAFERRAHRTAPRAVNAGAMTHNESESS